MSREHERAPAAGLLLMAAFFLDTSKTGFLRTESTFGIIICELGGDGLRRLIRLHDVRLPPVPCLEALRTCDGLLLGSLPEWRWKYYTDCLVCVDGVRTSIGPASEALHKDGT